MPALIGSLLRASLIGSGTFIEFIVPIMVDMMMVEYGQGVVMDERRNTIQMVRVILIWYIVILICSLNGSLLISWIHALMKGVLRNRSRKCLSTGVIRKLICTINALHIFSIHFHTQKLITPEKHLATLIINLSTTISRLLKRLFEYRRLRHSTHDCDITRMSTLVNLLVG